MAFGRNLLKERLALGLWFMARFRWSGRKFGPRSLPPLFGRSVLFLCDPNELSMDPDSLQERYFNWLADRGAKLDRITSIDEIARKEGDVAFVAISYEWFAMPTPGYFARNLRLRSCLADRGLSAICAAPDTVQWNLNIGYGLVSTVNDGVVMVTQNTSTETHRYGIPNVVSPKFFTWPISHQQKWSSTSSWSSRRQHVVLAGTGSPSRKLLLEPLGDLFHELGWEVSWSTGGRTYSDYIKQMQSARVIVTTSLVQEEFKWRLLDRWQPITTVTGRVWEGFMVEALVITNTCAVLDELGFTPGIHYIDLDEVLLNPNLFFELSDSEKMAIASEGRNHFLFTLRVCA